MLKEFRHFIARGNVIDLAVGVIMGAAFGKIVTTLVEGVLMPPMGLILGRIDFGSLFYVLDRSKGIPKSLAEAKQLGVPVIAYGQLINDLISFLLIAVAVFVLVKEVSRIKTIVDNEPPPEPTTRECPFCVSTISKRARRCPNCTSELAG
ncbi:MAG TPA: large conductance mechanosensitive channel protein MscL [Vicinamibacterales bacterium]|nr:large conductance mechanosensitive channel protein MscL [Vicinamibacterales bacterium]